MIHLHAKYGKIYIQSPYSEQIKQIIHNIEGRRWEFNDKEWSIPAEQVFSVYNNFDESYVSTDEYVTAYINRYNGNGKCYLRRIAEDVIELFYPYRKDIADVVRSFPYKNKIDINTFTINDEEAKALIRAIGRERIEFLKDESPHQYLYEAVKETLYLEYKEPVVIVKCSYEHGKILHKLISSIEFNNYHNEYQMPLHMIPNLIALVGKQNVILNDEINQSLKELFAKELPIKERLKDIKPVMQYDIKTNLLPHQIEAFNEGVTHNRLLIADSPGLGKTVEALSIACTRSNNDSSCLRNALIVCGVNSVKYNWEEEIHKHTNEDCVIFEGSTKKKLKMIDEWFNNRNCLFGIINIEALRNEEITKKLKELVSIVIVDEIHKAKNGNSQQGKALRELDASIKIGLSGTPMTNKPEDLWNILAWLDIEHRNYWQFRNTYCVLGGINNKQIVDYKNLDDLAMSLKEVMLRRKKEDVIDLPPKTYKTEYVELSASQKSDYEDAKNGVLKILDKILNSSNPLTHLLRLRQVTSGLFAEEKDNAKFKRIKELLEESIIPNGNKAILFTQYKEIAEYYKNAFSKFNPAYIVGEVSVEDRQKEVNRFQNDDNCKIAIGTIGAMGTGLTMTAASYVIFIDKDWAQTNNEQAEDRAHRIGTTKNVTIISVVAKNTVDEHIENILQEKARIFENIVEGKAIEKKAKKALLCEILGVSENSEF